MNTNFFETKEQYLNFRSAWTNAVNDSRSKSTLVPHDEYLYNKSTYQYTTSKGTGQHRVKGWIQAEHHILFNIILGRKANNGFTPITNPQKIISNNCNPDDSFVMGTAKLTEAIKIAGILTGKYEESKWYIQSSEADKLKIMNARYDIVNKIIGPFNGAITVEQLASINVDSVKKGD
jgi:hypothetical protein